MLDYQRFCSRHGHFNFEKYNKFGWSEVRWSWWVADLYSAIKDSPIVTLWSFSSSMRLWGTNTGQIFLLTNSRGIILQIVTRLMCTWSSINLRSSYDLWPPVRELTQLFPDFEHLTAAHFLDHFQGPMPHIWIFSTSDRQHVARKSFQAYLTNIPTLE
jgi:hypothetical protein